MDERLVRRIQEEHKTDDVNALRNAKLLAISSINSRYRITVEDILKKYAIGELNDTKTIKEIVRSLGAAKNDLHDAFEFIEQLFGKPPKGSIDDLDKQLEKEFGTCNWIEINKMLYGPNLAGANDPLSRFDIPHSDPGETKQEGKKTVSKIRNPKSDYNEAGVLRIMKALDSYIGWSSVKEQVQKIINLTKYNLDRKNRGKSYTQIMNHMIFTGNAGTGMSIVARFVGQIYKEIGLLSKGNFTRVSRADSIGHYIGYTKEETETVIKKVLGGVLFIDDAYTLSSKDSETDKGSGNRTIEVLVQAMENYRDDLIVIAAGNTESMQEFLDSNPSLKSQFGNTIHFDDYSGEELYQICLQMFSEQELTVSEGAKAFLQTLISAIYTTRDKSFKNTLVIRNLVDQVGLLHAERVATNMDKLTDEDKDTISLDDCQKLKRFDEYSEIIPE